MALLADSVGLALQVVIETLSPDERLAFVLHDMFHLPFEQISMMLDRTPQATRQLASRARRRVKGADIHESERNLPRQRAVVEAFFAASRAGDLDALVALLHPNVKLRVDFSPSQPHRSTVVHGAAAVAQQARLGARPSSEAYPALVNGAAGYVITRQGRPFAVMAFTVANGSITKIDVYGDRERVTRVIGSLLDPE
jgi:RNA polymerase sigma-70 factor (ECF subfamily)